MDRLCNVYAWIIRLYPKDFQYAFAEEMQSAFAARLGEGPTHVSAILGFVFTEAAAVIAGATKEWVAKMTTDRSVRSRHLPDLRMMRLPWVPRPEARRVGTISCSSDISR
jgi:hypothetical protein